MSLDLCLVSTTFTVIISAFNIILHDLCRGDGIYSCTKISFLKWNVSNLICVVLISPDIFLYRVACAWSQFTRISLQLQCIIIRCQPLCWAKVSSRYEFFLKEMSLQDCHAWKHLAVSILGLIIGSIESISQEYITLAQNDSFGADSGDASWPDRLAIFSCSFDLVKKKIC